jgi:hypothetical protein
MNTFDIFDLDNDGLLTKEEIETYRILCGLGSLSADVSLFCLTFPLNLHLLGVGQNQTAL